MDISTTLAGVKMATPFGVGSFSPDKFLYPAGTLEKTAELYMKFVKAGAGYLVMPSTVPDDKVHQPPEVPAKKYYIGRWLKTEYEGCEPGYFYCCPSTLEPPRWSNIKLQLALREKLPENVPLVTSILCEGLDLEEWAEHAKLSAEAGADMLEINAGCPIGVAESGGVPEEDKRYGLMLGVEPKIVGMVTKAVVDAVKVPVGVKITAEAGFPTNLKVVEAVKNAGAKYVVASHLGLTVAPPDIYNGGKGRWTAMDGMNPLGMVLGPWGRWMAYKTVTYYKMMFPDMDVKSGLGITVPEHVIETMMLGARASESLTAIALKGFDLIRRVKKFLENYMKEMKYETVDDFIGLGLKYITTADVAFAKARDFNYVA
ncbi:MAG: tRNA-dihydrouridine synthase, partial [Candidatus Bathyarchaeia archaeon]